MSTAERLRWLAHEVHRGRECCVAFSFNAENQREQIKFSLTDSYVCATVYRPCLLGALHSAQFAVECSISTDKGHKSSDGCTVVQFWLKQPSTHDTAAEDKTHMGQVAAMDAPGHSNGNTNGHSARSSWGANAAAHSADSPAISSFDIGVEGKVANSSLDGAVAGKTSPPRKRVRFSSQNDISFVDADTLAPQSLDEFLADIPPISSTCAVAELDASILKACTFLEANTREMQKCVAASEPFLPGDEHHDLVIRCAYLAKKFEAISEVRGPTDIQQLRDEFDDDYEALAAIYVGIKDDFEICLESAKTARDTDTKVDTILNNM